jgi:hypothetical protein
MKNYLKKITVLLLVGIAMASCSKSDPETARTILPTAASLSCSTTNTPFQQLYSPLINATHPEYFSQLNYITHEYTFQMTVAGSICSFGYQSQANLASNNYTIELYDTVSNTVVGSVTSTFSATTTSYVSVTPIAIVANRSYKLRRIAPATQAQANGLGRIVSNNVATTFFPATFGNMKIITGDFYSNSVSLGPNVGIPYIDFAFTPI